MHQKDLFFSSGWKEWVKVLAHSRAAHCAPTHGARETHRRTRTTRARTRALARTRPRTRGRNYYVHHARNTQENYYSPRDAAGSWSLSAARREARGSQYVASTPMVLVCG